MKYIGIDIAAEKHVVAVIDGEGVVLVKPTSFSEDAAGHQRLLELLGDPQGSLVAMEATGHYWQNVFAALAAAGFAVALLNPLRTRRFAEVDLARAKTDALDALAIARFALEKRPAATPVPDEATLELRELMRLRDRYVQDLGDRVRQLHRAVDLSFPEFTQHVRTLDSELATALLSRYPTAAQFAKQSPRRVAGVVYDGRPEVGADLAADLVAAAKKSVGRHHGPAYRMQIEDACEDIDTLRRRIKKLDHDVSDTLGKHKVGTLLTSIGGIGDTTAARLVAELGDIAKFDSGGALGALVGVVPAISQSGKRQGNRAPTTPFGDAKLRAKLWMPTLAAIKHNPWLRRFYDRLIARGKLPKVAITACMRKLLTAIYSVAKSGRPFVPILPPPTTTP